MEKSDISPLWKLGQLAMLLRFPNLSALAFLAIGLSFFGTAAGKPVVELWNSRTTDGQFYVTAGCVDPLYSDPVITGQLNRTSPVQHTKVSGVFRESGVGFNFYFPLRSQWDGRFFQLVGQGLDADDFRISFATESGAYTVQTNSSGGFRADAAAAKFSKLVAGRFYNKRHERIHGYIYGGGGGSYRVISAIEGSSSVWDGAVPFEQAISSTTPNNMAVKALAGLVLRDKRTKIAKTLRPGGSQNPYDVLNELERSILYEATSMGLPLRQWQDFNATADTTGLGLILPTVQQVDPYYADDFWTKPGYLGAEPSDLGDFLRSSKIEVNTTIELIEYDGQGVPLRIVLKGVPILGDTNGLNYTLYGASDVVLGSLSGTLVQSTGILQLTNGQDMNILRSLAKGRTLGIDNRWMLALHAYHRYQVPTGKDLHAYNQFRSTGGDPIYPQRSVLVCEMLASSISGRANQTGHINAKVIASHNLLDSETFPWHADWYRSQVEGRLGDHAFQNNYRIWYYENAGHNDGPIEGPRSTLLVQYTNFYVQALQFLIAWVESGVPPPRSTVYEVANAQVRIPTNATNRGGLQPSVHLTISGAESVSTIVGSKIKFQGEALAPRGVGEFVLVEWDFLGVGNFTPEPVLEHREHLYVDRSFTFDRPGTYFITLRVTLQRYGSWDSSFSQIQNLARVAVHVL